MDLVGAGSGHLMPALPYGVFSAPDRPGVPRVAIAFGDRILDAAAVPGAPEVLAGGSLRPLLAAGPAVWRSVRQWAAEQLSDPRGVEPYLLPAAVVSMRMPFEVADFVDFYASEQHARNLGRILRPGTEPLRPNWKHLPVGYHGRAGTVVVSGTPIVRPRGQRGCGDFGPSERLDIEAEIGFVVGKPSAQGEPVPMERFSEHVFGVCLVNDWSARDIQAWEYVPLGPFLGKSFATSISPWIVPLDALEAARVRPPARDVPLLPYLDDAGAGPWGLDIDLEVRLNGQLLSRPAFRGMYWTGAQQLAHLTVNGASVRTGDLFASGTVSGAERWTQGSLVELTGNGADPLRLQDGSQRSFLQDGDEVSICATAPGLDGTRVDLGAVTGRIIG